MEAFKLLWTTDAGVLTVLVIGFIIGMGIYLRRHITRLMNDEPGKEGW